MQCGRRHFLGRMAAAATGLVMPVRGVADDAPSTRHIVTLSFDDGFKESSIKTAAIHEKYGLSACINVIATGHHPDFAFPGGYKHDAPMGDFGLWNDLVARGHEVMPHGYRHANKRKLPQAEAQDLILRCLDVFDRELRGFDRKSAIFNFPYNASTPELEAWLPTQVRAFRTFGRAVGDRPRKGQVRLACESFGPGNCEAALEGHVEKLLARESGWLLFCAHGLDGEGWGPMGAAFLDRLLDRLLAIESVEILPAGRVLEKYAGRAAE